MTAFDFPLNASFYTDQKKFPFYLKSFYETTDVVSFWKQPCVISGDSIDF